MTARELRGVGSALVRLQRGLTGDRRLAGEPYMDDPDLLGAYLLYYWPVSYIEASLALAELDLRPARVLDLGSGPGPAAAAAMDAGASSVELADGSERALSLASRILARESSASGFRRVDLESRDCLSSFAGPYDLILLGHCLNELWRGHQDRIARRTALLERAAGLLSPGGLILALEPALLSTGRELLALRDALSERGYPIAGPCPSIASGCYACPILASGPDRTCHAEAAWDPPEPIAALAAAAALDRRSVKFAWFAASLPGTRRARTQAAPKPPRDGAVLEGRVVSDPMLNKAGRIRYVLCSGGALATVSAAKDSPDARGSGFLSLRRGDILRASGAEERPGGGYGLGPGSSLEILARFPEIDL